MPGAVGNFQTVLTGIHALKNEIGKIDTNLLNGDSNARFASIQGSIMPLLHDLEALASGGNIDSAVFFGDLFKLRQLKAAEVLNLLGQVQEEVSKDLAAARAASNEAAGTLSTGKITAGQDPAEKDKDEVTGLETLDTGLKTIANNIASLSTSFDAAFAPLIARLEQVDVWYDTVMQGFEERYTRHMKTVGIAISIGVVVVLNANFFSIYRSIKSDPVKTALIVQQGEEFLKASEQQNADRTGARAQSAPSPAPTSTASPTVSPAPSPSPVATETPVTVAEVKQDLQRVEDLAQVYESFGITPLSREQFSNLFAGNWRWRDLNETILGWAIMVMLLSAGAPFWQDTLESLFGFKNLLRKKSDTKNVEEGKGGQPKP
jgi:hypothetical protein